MTTRNEKLQKCRYSRNLKQMLPRAGGGVRPCTWLGQPPDTVPQAASSIHWGLTHSRDVPAPGWETDVKRWKPMRRLVFLLCVFWRILKNCYMLYNVIIIENADKEKWRHCSEIIMADVLAHLPVQTFGPHSLCTFNTLYLICVYTQMPAHIWTIIVLRAFFLSLIFWELSCTA